jgi:hypothetical protein
MTNIDEIQAIADVLRVIADFTSDLALLEKEYNFESANLAELINRIDMPSLLNNSDTRLLHAVIPLVQLAQIQSELSNFITLNHKSKKQFADKLYSICNQVESFVGRGGISSRPRDLDEDLTRNCLNKNYRDTANNAFPLIEDKLRAKLGLGQEYSGNKLLDYAFNTTSGKLKIGETVNEQEGVLLLFKGIFSFLRNPAAYLEGMSFLRKYRLLEVK